MKTALKNIKIIKRDNDDLKYKLKKLKESF